MEEVSKGIDAVAYYYELLGVWIPATMGGTKPKKTRKTQQFRALKKPDEVKPKKQQFDPFAIEDLKAICVESKQLEDTNAWKPIEPTPHNKTLDDYLNFLSESTYIKILPSDINATQPTNPEKQQQHKEISKPIFTQDTFGKQGKSNIVFVQDQSKTEPDTADWIETVRTKSKNRYIKRMIDFEEEQLSQPKVYEPNSIDMQFLSSLP